MFCRETPIEQKQRPDHELGSSGVLAGIHAPEFVASLEGVLGHWFVFILA